MADPTPEQSVAFVSMPFHVCAMPPIGLGILKAALEQSQMRCKVYNFNLDFLPYISANLNEAVELHDEISYLWDYLPGEWLFSPFQSAQHDRQFLKELQSLRSVRPEIVQVLQQLRTQAPTFVRECAERLILGGHDVIGFTSSFMQTQASVALANLLKIKIPNITIMFGGSNAFGSMGTALIEQFSSIDIVAHGEADTLIEPLIRALRGETAYSLHDIRGITYRHEGRIVSHSTGGMAPDMNNLPTPEYSDYFETVANLSRSWGGVLNLPQYIPVETARGCWWGEKSHCTFCGLNADRMRFRAKSPEIALKEFRTLYERYCVPQFFVVDNIIDHKYYDSLLIDLAAQNERFFIHYEIKANLKREHVEALAAAGVLKVQPGIESLSTPILKLMRKGITALQNVQTLKWLTEFGMRVSWFILYGFPKETIEPYHDMAKLVPKLKHLSPPHELAPVYLERFSPYHSHPESFGIQVLGPAYWYRFAFPGVDNNQLSQIAYRFDFIEPGRDPAINSFIEETLLPAVHQWKDLFYRHGCTLGIVHGTDETAIVCGPFEAPERVIRVGPIVSRVLRQGEAICAEKKLLDLLGDPNMNDVNNTVMKLDATQYTQFLTMFGDRVIAQDIRAVAHDPSMLLDLLDQSGLIMRESGKFLTLPVNWTSRAEQLVRLHSQELLHVLLG